MFILWRVALQQFEAADGSGHFVMMLACAYYARIRAVCIPDCLLPLQSSMCECVVDRGFKSIPATLLLYTCVGWRHCLWNFGRQHGNPKRRHAHIYGSLMCLMLSLLSKFQTTKALNPMSLWEASAVSFCLKLSSTEDAES